MLFAGHVLSSSSQSPSFSTVSPLCSFYVTCLDPEGNLHAHVCDITVLKWDPVPTDFTLDLLS